MSTARTRAGSAPPDALLALVHRLDPDRIDLPDGRARIRLAVDGQGVWDAVIEGRTARLVSASSARPDALLRADPATWEEITRDVGAGLPSSRGGRLRIRHSLHHGVGFLVATSGYTGPGAPRFHSVRTRLCRLSVFEAGVGDPVLAIHGLGGTKASFLPTVRGLADRHRVIAVDLPGFGESDKPLAAPYNAPWFGRAMTALLDELGIENAHLIGNSMGGRVALELGMSHPKRARRIVLISPALAWLRPRPWAPLLRLVSPKLGALQPAPRAVVEPIVRNMIPGSDQDGWLATGVDEFLRSFLKPSGRAAFYSAARNLALDQAHGPNGFWTRLEQLQPDSFFIWGRQDTLVPVKSRKYIERALPRAHHLELDCGHVAQVERPREVNEAVRGFLA